MRPAAPGEVDITQPTTTPCDGAIGLSRVNSPVVSESQRRSPFTNGVVIPLRLVSTPCVMIKPSAALAIDSAVTPIVFAAVASALASARAIVRLSPKDPVILTTLPFAIVAPVLFRTCFITA